MNTITLQVGESARPHAPATSDHVVYRLPGLVREYSHPFVREHGPLLVLGGSVDFPNLDWHGNPALPCSGVLLVGAVKAAELSAMLQQMPDPAVPVADFSGNRAASADFTARILDETTLSAALAAFTPILHRLSEIPFRAAREDRAAMHILRMAYSRNCAIDARLTAEAASVVAYPLLGHASPNRLSLEGLSLRGLLRRRHFMRTHACPQCTSHRLLAFEACHSCGGSDLVDEPLVHHYRCGCQQPESDFLHGNALQCPKCRRALRHFGMDYGKPGSVVHCRGCGVSAPEPDPRFACLDCSANFGGQAAKATDWFHYDLTEAGMAAARQGRLSGDAEAAPSSDQPALCSLREFHLLANAGLRHARRISNPMTIARCAPSDFAALSERYGAANTREILRRAGQRIAEALSESEYVTCTADCVLVGFAEWDAATSRAALEAACHAAAIGMAKHIDLQVELHIGEAAERLLEQY